MHYLQNLIVILQRIQRLTVKIINKYDEIYRNNQDQPSARGRYP